MAEHHIADLDKLREDKRQKTGWTTAEIKKRADEERTAYRKISEPEPDALASGGDMEKILEESDDDTKE